MPQVVDGGVVHCPVPAGWSRRAGTGCFAAHSPQVVDSGVVQCQQDGVEGQALDSVQLIQLSTRLQPIRRHALVKRDIHKILVLQKFQRQKYKINC